MSPRATVTSIPAVREIDPLSDERWTQFVATHPHASVFHSKNWLTALRDTYGYEPSVMCTSEAGRITAGVVFCRISSWLTGGRMVSLPFSDHCDPLFSAGEELQAILRGLRGELQENGGNYLELRPIRGEASLNTGLQECGKYLWHWIDLSRTREDLFRSFDKDCVQRRIRRAERELLQYETGNSEELLRAFFSLFVRTRRRHHVPPQPYSWFRHLSQSFGDSLQIRLLWSKRRPISSIITLKHGQTVVYKYGCSDAHFNFMGGMPLLFWRTIEEAKNEGLTRFDLGRSNLENAGLARFKENWGAKRVTLKYLTTGNGARADVGTIIQTLSRAISPIAPNWLFVSLGNVLYRHIG